MSTSQTDIFERLSSELDSWLSAGDLRTLRHTDAQAGSLAEFASAVKEAHQRGLHPFSGHVYFRGQWDKHAEKLDGSGKGRERLQLGATIDGLRYIAESTGRYGGQKGPYWCGTDGEWREIWLEDGHPAGCKLAVIRTDFDEPLWVTARWSAYANKTSNGRLTHIWQKMGPHMLAKCAEALAIRKAFPTQTAGLYTQEEMDQAHGTPQGYEANGTTSNGTASNGTASTPATDDRGDNTPDVDPAASGGDPEALNDALGLGEPTEDPNEAGTKITDNPASEQPEGQKEAPAEQAPASQAPAKAAQDRAEQNGSPDRTISEKQVKRAYAIAGEHGWDKAWIERLLQRRYGYDSMEDVTRGEEYDQLCEQVLPSEQMRSQYSRDPDTPDMFEQAGQDVQQAEDGRQEESAPSEGGGPDPDEERRLGLARKAHRRMSQVLGGPVAVFVEACTGRMPDKMSELEAAESQQILAMLGHVEDVVKNMPWSSADETGRAIKWTLTELDGGEYTVDSIGDLRSAFTEYAEAQAPA